MIKSGRNLGPAVGIALLLASSSAGATSPADIATARELYKQGADAFDAGHAAVAVEKLKAAWALLETPVIGVELARAHEKLGHLIEAREAAIAVLRMPKAPDETALSTSARADADKLAVAIEKRVPHVTIHLNGATAESTNVKLDGIPIPQAALIAPRQANPGTHELVADTTDGRHASATFTVGESEMKEVMLEIPAAPSVVAVKPPVPNVTPEPTVPAAPVASTHHASLSPLVWIGITVGGAGFVVGAIAGGMAFGAKGSLTTNCTLSNGTGDGKTVCPASSASNLSFAQTSGIVSTVGFVGFGVGVAVFVTGLLLSGGREPAHRASIAPMLGPISGVSGTF